LLYAGGAHRLLIDRRSDDAVNLQLSSELCRGLDVLNARGTGVGRNFADAVVVRPQVANLQKRHQGGRRAPPGIGWFGLRQIEREAEGFGGLGDHRAGTHDQHASAIVKIFHLKRAKDYLRPDPSWIADC
jgi:hypothetical protein